MRSLQIAIAGFVVPFMAVYAPELMLQGDAGILDTAFVIFKALLAVSLWGMGVVGYWLRHFNWIERLLAVLAAVMLVFALPFTDEIGIVLALLLLGRHWLQFKRQPPLAVA